jgi:hypothetical protein
MMAQHTIRIRNLLIALATLAVACLGIVSIHLTHIARQAADARRRVSLYSKIPFLRKS